MITRVQYLRLSSLLPIIAPFPLLIVSTLLESSGIKLPAWLDALVGVSFSAAFMFGVPYCIFIGVLFVLLYERSWKAHVITALVAPVLMIPIVGIFVWVLTGNNGLATALQFAPYCLGVGYTYVGIALFGMCALIVTGRFKNEQTV